jgi:hypothetical protein
MWVCNIQEKNKNADSVITGMDKEKVMFCVLHPVDAGKSLHTTRSTAQIFGGCMFDVSPSLYDYDYGFDCM